MKVPEWKLEAFHWLPIEQWTPERLLTLFSVAGKRYCKVCDSWVSPEEEKKHVALHVKQVKELRKKQKLAALKLAREERARKKQLRDAGLA